MSASNTLPRALRRELEEAGVKRAELHVDSATSRKLDFHDLRHTYGTWRAVRGDEIIKIRFAMGHTDLQTTQRYINEAQVFGDRFGVPFGPLPESLNSAETGLETSGNRQRPTKIYQKHRVNRVEAGGIEPQSENV